MKFCEECGAQLEDEVMFCEECGAQFDNVVTYCENYDEKAENTSCKEDILMKEEGKEKRKIGRTNSKNEKYFNGVPILIFIAVLLIVNIVIGVILLCGQSKRGDYRGNTVTDNEENIVDSGKDFNEVTDENSMVSDETSDESSVVLGELNGNTTDINSSHKLFGNSPYGIYMTETSDFVFLISKEGTEYYFGFVYYGGLYNIDDYVSLTTKCYEEDILYGQEYAVCFMEDPSWLHDITFGIDSDGYCSFEWSSGYRVSEVVFDDGIPAVNSQKLLFDSYEEYCDYFENIR